jgi:hypothetical protein
MAESGSEENIASNSRGVLLALVADGTQDKWCRKNSGLFDTRLSFLHNRHQWSYNQLETENKEYKNNEIRMIIKRQCDLINMVDLIIDNPDNLPIGSIIKFIKTEYGGQYMDALNDETQIKTNAAIFKRPITNMNGKTIIPLTLAPLHEHNVVFPSMEHHELVIWITFHIPDCNPRLFANVYYLEEPDRKHLFSVPHEFATLQTFMMNDFKNKIIRGANAYILPFNHPTYMIYFWGFDKSKVTNIALNLNGHPYYNGPIEPLEHQKALRGLAGVEPTFIFFSNDRFDEQLKSSVNFSRIDSIQLVITTDQEEESEMCVAAINLQGYRCASGMFGLVYSK